MSSHSEIRIVYLGRRRSDSRLVPAWTLSGRHSAAHRSGRRIDLVLARPNKGVGYLQ